MARRAPLAISIALPPVVVIVAPASVVPVVVNVLISAPPEVMLVVAHARLIPIGVSAISLVRVRAHPVLALSGRGLRAPRHLGD